MTTYYKAVRPDGTDFRTGTVRWLPPVCDPMPGGGMVVTHPTSRNRTDGGADGYLSVATVATECTGMRWPCRLAVVEPTRCSRGPTPPETNPADAPSRPSKKASARHRKGTNEGPHLPSPQTPQHLRPGLPGWARDHRPPHQGRLAGGAVTRNTYHHNTTRT